jgi:hypothetical protein
MQLKQESKKKITYWMQAAKTYGRESTYVIAEVRHFVSLKRATKKKLVKTKGVHLGERTLGKWLILLVHAWV